MVAWRPRVTALVLASAAMGPAAGTAQQPAGDRAPRSISAKPQEFPEAFTSVRSLTALPDGRLVLSDAQEKKVMLVDFAKGTTAQLARSGAGPREYQSPGGTYRAAGGGALIYDQQQHRFLPITTAGRLLDVVAVPGQVNSTNVSDEGPDQFAVDTLENWYTLASRQSGGAGRDSLALLHIDKSGRISDTVGYLLQQESRSVPSSNPNIRLGLIVAFSPRDIWAVAPDGGVAIVKAAPYRVDWYRPSSGSAHGPAVPFTPLKVTAADRDAVLARMTSAPPPRVSINGQAPVSQAMPRVEPVLSDVKPPFPPQVPRIDEHGRLWVERSDVADAKRRTYDIFDRRGALVDRIQLPAGSRLVGFDSRSLYAVRSDEDDLLHLQRFQLP